MKASNLANSCWGLFQGIVPIQRQEIWKDVAAGVTLAALGIPEVMGYTRIAQTPVVTGLYTLVLPVIVFAVLAPRVTWWSRPIRQPRPYWQGRWFITRRRSVRNTLG